MTEEAAPYNVTPTIEFGMRQVVRYPGARDPGTVIGRGEIEGRAVYLVRPCESESADDARPFLGSQLTAFLSPPQEPPCSS